MKLFKHILLTCALGISGFLVNAQTDSVDISTGRTLNGMLQVAGAMDDYWTCLRPGQGFLPVMVGTGFDALTGRDYTGVSPNGELSTHAGILVPYPVTSSAEPCFFDYYSYFSPANVGDIRHGCSAWTEPVGRYYFTRKLNIGVPPCKQITDAYIRVKILAGFDYADLLFVNGHQLTIASYNPQQASANPEEAAAHGYTEYVIPVNPAWLLAGNNNTITVTVNKSSISSGTGFICEAWMVYTLGTGGGPSVNFAGTTTSACVGSNAVVMAQISNTNPGSYTYTATLKGLVSGTTTYANVGSSITLAQTPGSFYLTPVSNTHYKLLVVSNDVSGCSAEVVVPLATNCHARFNPSINLNAGNITVQATPSDREETTFSGFQQTWTLEDLDPASLQPVYVINDPACWRLEAGASLNFEGFDAVNNDYESEYQTNQTVAINCPGDAGLFKPHHLYRLTRSVKSAAFDWETFSTIIQPGANPEFNYNFSSVSSGKYNLDASSANEAQEAQLVGFEQKWLLEKIEPGSNKILYAIESPACWNGAANTLTTFDGFDPIATDYEFAYQSGPITISCVNANAGVFEEGHHYRLTRFVKGETYDWTGHAEYIIPGGPLYKTEQMKDVKNAPDNTSEQNATMVYPNPGTGLFTILAAGKGTIDIYDVTGRHIKQLHMTEGSSRYHMDLSGMAKGMYTVKIQSGKGIEIKKVVME